MDRGLISSLNIRYNGFDADKHLIDGVYLGKSIQGIAKLYNDALFLFEQGKLPSPHSVYTNKIYMGVPKEGSIFIGLSSMIAAGQMSLYPELWRQMAKWFVPLFIKAIYNKLLNRDDEVKQIIEFSKHENQKSREHATEMARMAINTVVTERDRFLEIIEQYSMNNKHAVRLSVEPVGRSCSTITQEKDKTIFLEIDEPSAEVIRSKEEIIVTELAEYKCKLEGVSKTKKSCGVKLIGSDYEYAGKINDPQLQNINNVYTHALDMELEIIITAKTTIKKGEIQKFYISDAKLK